MNTQVTLAVKLFVVMFTVLLGVTCAMLVIRLGMSAPDAVSRVLFQVLGYLTILGQAVLFGLSGYALTKK